MSLPAPRPNVSLLITDLDNTLWDWVHAWYAQFMPLLNELVKFTGVDQAELEKEIRKVHQARGTSEYSWLIYELDSVKKRCGDQDPMVVLDEALHKQNSARIKGTHLYDGVVPTLTAIRNAGVPVVAYTESQAYWTKWRIKRLGLDGLLNTLYSSPDHDAPLGFNPEDKRLDPKRDYALERTEHHHVHGGILKPNPQILEDILNEYDVPKSQVLYVGDSLMKDVAMAQSVGVMDVHAKYGIAQHRKEYEQLRRVTHWTPADVERERQARPEYTPTASCSLDKGFYEIMEKFSFGA